jgi:hypothetical protein
VTAAAALLTGALLLLTLFIPRERGAEFADVREAAGYPPPIFPAKPEFILPVFGANASSL